MPGHLDRAGQGGASAEDSTDQRLGPDRRPARRRSDVGMAARGMVLRRVVVNVGGDTTQQQGG